MSSTSRDVIIFVSAITYDLRNSWSEEEYSINTHF